MSRNISAAKKKRNLSAKKCRERKISFNPHSFLADRESMEKSILPEDYCIRDDYVIYKEIKAPIPSNPP